MKSILSILTLMVMSALASIAAEAPQEMDAKLELILKASKAEDIAAFKAMCDANMKKQVTPELLKKINAFLEKMNKDGYKLVYFGVLDRVNFKTYYWKMDSNQEGVADLLVQMSIIDGKVAGFYLL